jgi:hypothetical protein
VTTEEELKWMTKRYSWRYIPSRYQALVATIVSALLYFNAFGIIFSDRSTGDCGTFLRPRLEGDGNPRGWITNSLSGSDTYCSPGYFNGLFWEFLFTFAGIALCGLVMRRAIKRDEATKSV